MVCVTVIPLYSDTQWGLKGTWIIIIGFRVQETLTVVCVCVRVCVLMCVHAYTCVYNLCQHSCMTVRIETVIFTLCPYIHVPRLPHAL